MHMMVRPRDQQTCTWLCPNALLAYANNLYYYNCSCCPQDGLPVGASSPYYYAPVVGCPAGGAGCIDPAQGIEVAGRGIRKVQLLHIPSSGTGVSHYPDPKLGTSADKHINQPWLNGIYAQTSMTLQTPPNNLPAPKYLVTHPKSGKALALYELNYIYTNPFGAQSPQVLCIGQEVTDSVVGLPAADEYGIPYAGTTPFYHLIYYKNNIYNTAIATP